MTPTEEQKAEVEFLLESGDKLKAVRYIQEHFGLNADQAIAFAEQLEKQMDLDDHLELERTRHELTTSTSNLNKVLFTIFGGIGAILLVIGLIIGWNSYRFLQVAQPVTGKIVDFTSYESIDKDDGTRTTMYTPTIEYTWNGKTSVVKHNISTSNQPTIGEPIDLLIDPDEPTQPEEDSFFSNWFVTILMSAMGFVFLTVGIVIRRTFGKPATAPAPRYQQS